MLLVNSDLMIDRQSVLLKKKSLDSQSALRICAEEMWMLCQTKFKFYLLSTTDYTLDMTHLNHLAHNVVHEPKVMQTSQPRTKQ